jgi:hypothetical protein
MINQEATTDSLSNTANHTYNVKVVREYKTVLLKAGIVYPQ